MRHIRQAMTAMIDLALPPRCPGCGVVTGEQHQFCSRCWSNLRFLGPPWCAACHEPFQYDRGEGALCASCLNQPPRHAGIRAAVAYGDVARHVTLRLKYGGRTALAETISRAMTRLLPGNAELLVPVPLHRRRLWSRGFNQAALIAGALAERAGVPVEPCALIRRRSTPVLRGLGARQRSAAVKGAFAVPAKQVAKIRGRHIVLVDDVHTSGATSNACTSVLLRAGAAAVTILCWARVLDGEAD